MSFDWQTEEDRDWDEQEWRDKPVTAVTPKPPWRTILLMAILLAVAAGFIYQQISKRLDSATSTVESDIFATHNLLSQAAANRDAQLGKAVLSGRDLGWSRAEADLLAEGLFFEPTGLGLTLPEETAAFDPLSREDERFVELTLEPDLSGAELAYARDFVALTDDGLQTVTLQQTAVYRLGKTRWLLAPPIESFWGEWQTRELDNLTTIYPQRDEELLLELSADLQTLLTETCEELPELNCSPDDAIQIRFDTNPESVLETADPANLYDGNLRLDLPTPTLIGLPIDSDGYEALLNAYGAKMIAALIGQSVEYDCCDHAPLFETILTYQLAELGLAVWPVTVETETTLAESGVHTDKLFSYWNSDDFSFVDEENSVQLLGFVDFLLKGFLPQQTAVTILTQLESASSYQGWLGTLVDSDINNAVVLASFISREWWFYVLTQSEETAPTPSRGQAVSNPPIPFPTQDLQLSCSSTGSLLYTPSELSNSEMYRYQLDNDSWTEELAYQGLGFFNPLPQDEGVILQLLENEAAQWQTVLWQNGIGVDIFDAENQYSISLGQADPDGRFLLYYLLPSSGQDSFPVTRLMDIKSCLLENCSSMELGATLIWSPDGKQSILNEQPLFLGNTFMVDGRILLLNSNDNDEPLPLQLSDAVGSLENRVDVGLGTAPFWITNDLFGFIQSASGADRLSDQELVLMSPDGLQAEVIATTADLREQIPEDNPRNGLFMRYAIAHPANPDLLLVMASVQSQNRHSNGFLFQLNRQTRAIELLFELDLAVGLHTLGFSPDGRFLITTDGWLQESIYDDNIFPFGRLYIYDFETAEDQTILTNNNAYFPAFIFDWSADGNWLAISRSRNVIDLIAPAYNYQKTITHQAGDCTSLAWINPIP